MNLGFKEQTQTAQLMELLSSKIVHTNQQPTRAERRSLMRLSYHTGAFACLTCKYLGIKSKTAAITFKVDNAVILNCERKHAPFKEEILDNYIQNLGFPSTIFKTLNNSNENTIKKKTALYNLLIFLREHSTQSTEINIILCMIRLVSGFFDQAKFIKEIKATYDEYYGLSRINDIDKRILNSIETDVQPTFEQLRLYATFLQIDTDILSFWNDAEQLKKASECQKVDNLYIICLASMGAYHVHYING